MRQSVDLEMWDVVERRVSSRTMFERFSAVDIGVGGSGLATERLSQVLRICLDVGRGFVVASP